MDQIVSIPLPDPAAGGAGSAPRGESGGAAMLPFFAGPENGLAEVAVWAVVERPGSQYNPLVIAGETGLGKSHLARGLAAAFQTRYPRRPVVCQPALDFAREWTDALESQAIDGFRRRYHAARLIVLDDLTRLADHERAQQALVPLLDAAAADHRQVVVTAPSPPGRWVRMSAALQSRLEAGLCVRLVPPEKETRLALIRYLAGRRGLVLSEPVAGLLAGGLRGSVRELIGAVAAFDAAAKLEGQPIDAAAARAYLARRQPGTAPALSDLAAAVGRIFGLPVAQLRGRSQRQQAVSARGVAMYLARRHTELTLEQIGRYFGGRDHTTVLHQCRKTAQLLDTEPDMETMINDVEQLLLVKQSAAAAAQELLPL